MVRAKAKGIKIGRPKLAIEIRQKIAQLAAKGETSDAIPKALGIGIPQPSTGVMRHQSATHSPLQRPFRLDARSRHLRYSHGQICHGKVDQFGGKKLLRVLPLMQPLRLSPWKRLGKLAEGDQAWLL